MKTNPEWAEPGAFEVAPGVYRIPLPMPGDALTAVNVYAIEDKRGLTLIDGGWAVESARTALENALRLLGASPRSITRILVTHGHRDHYTMAVQLRREFGIPIALGIGERPMLEEVSRRPKNFEAQIVLLREAGADELARTMEASNDMVDLSEGWDFPDEWLVEGEIDLGTRRLQILSTPGHTRGHVVFADLENKLLLAGDHVLPSITPSIGLEPGPMDSPLRDFLASLAKVRALPDMRLFAAHGPAAPSTHARIAELVTHHDERLALIRKILHGATQTTALTVASNMGWTRRLRAYADLDPFNQMLAIAETIAHLRVLVAAGFVTNVRDPSGVVLYAGEAT